jgi:hypothetical protein
MGIFIADCPKGHKGAFVTANGWHTCSCDFQIVEFDPHKYEDKPDVPTLIKQAIQRYHERLLIVDPEYRQQDYI